MANLVSYQTEHGEVKLSPEIVKKYLVSGKAEKVTDQEVVMFIQLCRYQGLNPFLREAYLIKYGDAPATFVTGKDTFIKRATNSDQCIGYEAGVVTQKKDGSIEQRKGSLVLQGETLVGGWAKVFRKDWHVPLEITVSIEEYKRCNNEGKPMKNWNDMPATMIRKVALVQALREAMPEKFVGLYSPEEMPVDDSKLDTTGVQSKDFDEIQTMQLPSAVITEKNRKYLWILSKKNEEILKSVIKKYGYISTTEIKTTHFDLICDEIKKEVYAKEQREAEDVKLPWEDIVQNDNDKELTSVG